MPPYAFKAGPEDADARVVRVLFTTLLTRAFGARGEPWGLAPWRDTGRSYRLVLIGTLLVDTIAIGTAMLLVERGSTSPLVMAVGAIVTLLSVRRVVPASTAHRVGQDSLIALPLAAIGELPAALLVIAIARSASAWQRPLVPHLHGMTLANDLFGIALVSLAASAAGGFGAQQSGLWVVAVASAMLVAVYAPSFATYVAARCAGYVGERASFGAWVRSTALDAVAEIPLMTLVAWVGGHGQGWMAAALPVLPATTWARSRREQQAYAATELADTDPLTMVLNRRGLGPALRALLAHPAGGSVLLCDLDDFKQVNDRLGHAAGDDVLTRTARAILEATQAGCEHGSVGRLGGDEFVVTLPGVNAPAAVAIGTAIVQRVLEDVGALGVGISIGVHEREAGDDEHSVIRRADTAMYGAKQARVDGKVATSSHGVSARLFSPRNQAAAAWWGAQAQEYRARGDVHMEAFALYQQYWSSPDDAASDILIKITALGTSTVGWAARAAAAQAIRDGKWAEARAHDLHATRIGRARGDVVLQVVAQLGAAHAAISSGHHEHAVAHCDHARELASVHQMHRWHVQAALRHVELLIDHADVTRAQQIAEHTRKALSHQNAAEWLPLARATEAWATSFINEDEALDHAHVALTQLLDTPQAEHTATTAWLVLCTRAMAGVGDAAESIASLAGSGPLLTGLAHTSRSPEELAVLAQGDVGTDWFTDTRPFDLFDVIAARLLTWRGQPLPTSIGVSLAIHGEAPSRLHTLIAQELEWLSASERGSEIPLPAWSDSGAYAHSALCAIAPLVKRVQATSVAEHQEAIESLLDQLHSSGCTLQEQRIRSALTTTTATPPASAAGPSGQAPTTTLDSLFSSLGSRHSISRNQAVFTADSDAETVYLIREGIVRVFQRAPDGKELTVSTAHAGSLIGEAGIVDAHAKYGVHASALTPCVVDGVPAEHVRAALATDAGATLQLVEQLAQRTQAASQLAERIAYRTLQQRLAALLVDLDKQHGHPTLDGTRLINVSFTQQQLADMLAATRPSVSLAIGALRDEGIIQLRGKRIEVVQPELLARLAGNVNDAGAESDGNSSAREPAA